MSLLNLKQKLSKYGTPQIVKEGVVFTVLITGKDLSNFEKWSNIQKLVIDYAGKKYPKIEAFVNEETFFCLILHS